MTEKNCAIGGCTSSSVSVDDRGVTFHTFPVNKAVRQVWISQTNWEKEIQITKSIFVCSRHFRSTDFSHTKTNKYLLNKGSVPTIFPWGITPHESVEIVRAPKKTADNIDSDIKEILVKTETKKRPAGGSGVKEPKKKVGRKSFAETAALQEALQPIKAEIVVSTPIVNFIPGTKIEAQDFNGVWHSARIQEVDQDDREVLIHFEKNNKIKAAGPLNNEWISMDSSRLRTAQQVTKPTLSFTLGEKCVARWSGPRKFPGTVNRVLDNDTYEILFDDGYSKIVKNTHMAKLKPQKNPTSTTTSPATPMPPVFIPHQLPAILPYEIPKFDLTQFEFPEIPKEGEWCCNWINDVPIGKEGVVNFPDGKSIKTVIPEDLRQPEGWVKHIYRSQGAIGKWGVIFVAPDGRCFRMKQELKVYLEQAGIFYSPMIFDFGIHKKRAKELGCMKMTPEYALLYTPIKVETSFASPSILDISSPGPILDKDFAMVGSVKVQIIDNLFRCPAEACGKNFRKENHLQIHIKHYHEDLAKLLGVFPNMTDLAYQRTMGTPTDETTTTPKNLLPNVQFFEKVHQMDIQTQRAHRKSTASLTSPTSSVKNEIFDMIVGEEVIKSTTDTPLSPPPQIPFPMDQEIKTELIETPKKKVTLLEEALNAAIPDRDLLISVPLVTESVPIKMDADELIQSHSLSKVGKKKSGRFAYKAGFKFNKGFKGNSKKRNFLMGKKTKKSVAENLKEVFSKHPDEISSKAFELVAGTEIPALELNPSPKYINEDGELIKIVRMKQEEIINCLCAFTEEDGLMIQCELCLCWQHGTCFGIERENQVPEKYVCFICKNPQKERKSMKYIHDQEWLYDGKLPFANYHVPNPKHEERFKMLKETHQLTGNLLELKTFLHSLQVKINISKNKDHPKLYLWSKPWEEAVPSLPTKPERNEKFDIKTEELVDLLEQETKDELKDFNTPSRRGTENEKSESKVSKTDESGGSLLTDLLQTPGGTSIDFAMTHRTPNKPNIPQPEAIIDPAECQIRLLNHISKQQDLAMNRLDEIENLVMQLESLDPKAQAVDDQRLKSTIKMLIRDLGTMRKISEVNVPVVHENVVVAPAVYHGYV